MYEWRSVKNCEAGVWQEHSVSHFPTLSTSIWLGTLMIRNWMALIRISDMGMDNLGVYSCLLVSHSCDKRFICAWISTCYSLLFCSYACTDGCCCTLGMILIHIPNTTRSPSCHAMPLGQTLSVVWSQRPPESQFVCEFCWSQNNSKITVESA